MSATAPKFVIFRDMKDGYRWRLCSPTGETLEYSERGRSSHAECEQDVYLDSKAIAILMRRCATRPSAE